MGINVLSLFDGMSVAQQALTNSGFDIDTYYASEIDKYAIATTQSNFPNTIQLGSVVDIKGCDFKDVFLLIGGSPCQDLSIAKKDRQGLKGQRSGLFYEYVRIKNEVKPKYFILENVNSMPKEAKDQISEILGVLPVMINASLVSAQNRKRLFWVGKLQEDGTYKQVEISQPEDKGILLKDILEQNVEEKYFLKDYKTNWSSDKPIDVESNKYKVLRVGGDIPSIQLRDKSLCIDANYYKGTSVEHYNEKSTRQLVPDTIRIGSLNSGGQGDRIYSEEGKSVSLSANGGGRGAKTGLYVVALTEQRTEKDKIIRKENRKNGVDFSPRREKELVPRKDEKANTITTGQTKESLILENKKIRKLTPIECLRLQSMPDNYFDSATYKNKTISDTQRYKMCGNAFNCDVISHILKGLK